jgi:hypothetical protein
MDKIIKAKPMKDRKPGTFKGRLIAKPGAFDPLSTDELRFATFPLRFSAASAVNLVVKMLVFFCVLSVLPCDSFLSRLESAHAR